MDTVEWIVWGVTETAKYMLISYGILGFEVRRGLGKYGCFLYLLAGGALTSYFGWSSLLFRTSWGVVFVLSFYGGRIRKRLQAALLEYLAISAVDTFVWGVVVALCRPAVQGKTPVVDMISGCVGIAICFFVAAAMRGSRKRIYESFCFVPFRYYALISALILGVAGVAGGAQGNVKNEMTEHTRHAVLIITLLSLLLVLVVSVILICTLHSEKQLELMNEYNQKYFDYQKSYYEKLIVKDEEVRRFRHDLKKHIHVLNTLYRENKYREIGTYLGDLDSKTEDISMLHTGNEIVDCFVNGIAGELRQDGKIDFRIIGRFPERMKLSDSDLCVLFGNAFDNAKEALLQVEGKRELKMEIRNLRNILMVRITNSAVEPRGRLLESTKADKGRHGYGTWNMKQVVEKYGGDIDWYYEGGQFVVEIQL